MILTLESISQYRDVLCIGLQTCTSHMTTCMSRYFDFSLLHGLHMQESVIIHKALVCFIVAWYDVYGKKEEHTKFPLTTIFMPSCATRKAFALITLLMCSAFFFFWMILLSFFPSCISMWGGKTVESCQIKDITPWPVLEAFLCLHIYANKAPYHSL